MPPVWHLILESPHCSMPQRALQAAEAVRSAAAGAMAGNSPTSPLPGVTRGGGRPAPIGSLTSVTMHSPIGSLSSVNGGVFIQWPLQSYPPSPAPALV